MEDKLIQLMKDALEDESVTMESTMENLEAWDSLGHLSVLSALDDRTDGKISDIREFNDVETVVEIITLLEKNNLSI